MRRRIFLWMGLVVLFSALFIATDGYTKESYRVQRGDTLYSIAGRVGVDVAALKAANGLHSNGLTPGQLLRIPTAPKPSISKNSPPKTARAAHYTVQKSDTLAGIARKTGVTVAELRDLNGLRGNALKAGQRLLLRNDTAGPIRSGKSVHTAVYSRDSLHPEPEGEEEPDSPLAAEYAWDEIERTKRASESLLGKWTHPDEPKLLVKVAMGFLGAPYRLGGSSVTGIDCSGFVKKIYNLFNIDLPRTAMEQSLVGMRVSRDELCEGDLLFFGTTRFIGHVGIYVGGNKFVHASSQKRGVRVDDLDTPYFDRRFVRAVRVKGMDGTL
jgi:cell wall-associated NlpC family hydrolase